MYKALITDLDGTAVPVASYGDEIDAATQQAVAAATQAGYVVACASGRDWDMCRSVLKKLGLKAPCVIEGGTRIIDPITGNTKWEKDLEHGESQRIFKLFKLHAPGGIITTSADTALRPLKEINSVPDILRYIYVLSVDIEPANALRDAVNEVGQAIAHLTPSWNGQGLFDVHVTHSQATKEHAIAVWHDMVGVSKAQTIGMGDSGNDLPLFRSAGFKVAVANATAEVMEQSDYLAPSVDEHALKHVIDKFLLSQEK